MTASAGGVAALPGCKAHGDRVGDAPKVRRKQVEVRVQRGVDLLVQRLDRVMDAVVDPVLIVISDSSSEDDAESTNEFNEQGDISVYS